MHATQPIITHYQALRLLDITYLAKIQPNDDFALRKDVTQSTIAYVQVTWSNTGYSDFTQHFNTKDEQIKHPSIAKFKLKHSHLPQKTHFSTMT